jgi:transposase
VEQRDLGEGEQGALGEQVVQRCGAAIAIAAVTLPFHNGRTEGMNTKMKMIKRQMYGRAGFALLRHRILLG